MSDHGRPISLKLDMLDDVYEGNPYGTAGSLALEIPQLVLDESPAPSPKPTQGTIKPVRLPRNRSTMQPVQRRLDTHLVQGRSTVRRVEALRPSRRSRS